ncbi:hypothetical protein BOX15_Mlig026659g1 [Macrostomum lignano]|uniref:Uncharacterized protein n=1 Tax=Macrostomum lignano TaxID=282301 RepID=A0A267F7F4_9PLAT|nr:hypothetical protein BOX15_Mlig026659g1 [Macrostomum lignano]
MPATAAPQPQRQPPPSLPVSRGSVIDSELEALMRAHPERTRELLYGLYNIPTPGLVAEEQAAAAAAAAEAAGPKGRLGKSHYQDTYIAKELRKRSSKRPPPAGGGGGKRSQAMSWDTSQRADFVPKDLRAARNEPVQKKGGDGDGPSWVWRDQMGDKRATVYQDEYKERPLGPVEHRKPDAVRGGAGRVLVANGQFQGQTTSMADYKGWSTGRNPIRYGEMPEFMGSVLNPGRARELETVNQSTYKGPRGVPAIPAVPAVGNLALDGVQDFTTVNRDTYRPMPPGLSRPPPARQSNEAVMERKLPMHSETQTRADFKGYDTRQFKRSERSQPPEAMVDLKYDRNGYWNTEQRHEFRGVDVTHHPVPASFKKDPSQYTAPEGRMEGESTSHLDYQTKDLREAYRERVKPPEASTRFAGKFASETTSSEAYRRAAAEPVSPRMRHGDFHLAYHHVPKFDRLEGDSETRSSFVAKPLAPTVSFKPVVTAAPTDGERDFDTVYKSVYKPPRFRLTREQAAAVKAELRRLEAARSCHPALPGIAKA